MGVRGLICLSLGVLDVEKVFYQCVDVQKVLRDVHI